LRNGQPLGTGLNQLTAGAGTYLVTGTDVNGCTGTAEVLISTGGGTPFTVSASLTEVCAVRPVTLTASDPNLSYSWAPGNAAGQTVSLAVAPNTTITVTATNTGGCTSTQTLTIGPASGLIPQVTISEPLTCIQNATLSVTPAVSGFTYQWSDGIITGPTRTNTGAGTYTVTVTDPATGCSGSASVAIAAPTGPVILQETITNIACFGGSTGRIQLTLSQPLDVQSIAWTGPNGFTASSLTISDLVAGSYTIRVTNAAGCVLQQTYTLTEPPLLNATTTVTEEICGVPGKATTNVTGGVPPYAFAWAGTDGYASTQQNPMDLTGGTYTLTVTDANTCTATLTVTIGQNLNFTPGVVAATITICEGQTTTLTATGAQIYAWAPGGSVMGNNNTASVTVQPATTTTFTVLGTLGSCTGTATILVVVTPKPATIDTLVATCPNEPLNLIRPGVGRWGWEPQTGVLFINDNQVVLNPAANAVDYTVTVPVGVECSTPGRVRFTRYPADTTRIRQTPAEPLAGQGFVLEALGSAANTYRWQFIDSLNGNPAKVGQTVSHVFQRPGEQTIELTTTTPEGCTSRQTLRRIYQPSPVEVPSVFSPNGDDLNDRFGVVGFFTYQTYSLLIFDRWGNQIFEANSPTQTWDGTKNRNRVPEGVYVYRLTIRFEANQPLLERAGTITVVR
jgi:gliding motility-associated-like protein